MSRCHIVEKRLNPSIVGLLRVYALTTLATTAAFVSKEDHGSIGFDFTPSSVTSAIAFKNGSRFPLAHVEGNDGWRSMLSHLATDIRPDDLQYGPEYVQVMAEMIRSLAAESERMLGRPVGNASASVPLPFASSGRGEPYTHLVKDAFEDAGVGYIEVILFPTYDTGERLVHIGNSVRAGHGLGLCQPYWTASARCAWEQNLPAIPYLLIGFHANALEICTTTEMRSALDIHAYAYPNYHLGAEMRHSNPQEDFYWEAVWDHIRLPSIKWRVRVPEKVIVYGEFSEDQHLRALIQRMLREWLLPMGKKLPEWVDDGVNATFVGAMGAADFAMRKPFWDHNKATATEQRMIGPQIVL